MDLGIRSADDIIPEWQNLRVGDIVLWNREEGLPVLTLNPLRTLVMGGRMDPLTGRLVDLGTPKPDIYLDASWVFFLDDLAERTTRLIVRARFDWKPHTLIWMGVRLVLEPAHFVMERKTLLGIKRRAERLRVGRGHDPHCYCYAAYPC